MEQKQLQEFIHFINASKSLTRAQRLKRDLLMARDHADKQQEAASVPDAPQPQPAEFKPLSALATAQFLALFNDPMGLKYLTHDFDPDMDGRPHTLEALHQQALTLIKSKNYQIPPSLWSLINKYLDGGGEWIDTFGQKHRSCIKDTRWQAWSRTNNMHPINNPAFAVEVMAFRSAVRLVAPALTDICSKAKEGLALNVTEEKTDRADFYTNTYRLFIVLKRILAMMNRRADKHPNVTIAYRRKTDSQGRMLRQLVITQSGSLANRSIAEVKDRLLHATEAGDFGAIRNNLNGYCLWQVETQWDGQPARWNILKTCEQREIDPLASNEVVGFRHILSYYIV